MSSNVKLPNYQTRIEEEHRDVNGVTAKAVIPFNLPTYTERYDISGPTIYVGQALPGSATSDPVWAITKYNLADLTAADGQITLYGAVWDNRATEVYY
jgi:hypothetical protein